MQVEGLAVQIVRKAIRTLRLSVCAPQGYVRVSAPLRTGDDLVRLFVVDKLRWIRKQQARLATHPRPGPPAMVSGEQHAFLGQSYRLEVVEQSAPARITLREPVEIELRVRPASTAAQREELLYRWYRQQLKTLIPPLLDIWQPVIGVSVADWGVRRMRTRWGSCNTRARRIWLSAELAKKPHRCLEYVVVHELVHLLERRHNARFYGYMDRFLPEWRTFRSQLNMTYSNSLATVPSGHLGLVHST